MDNQQPPAAGRNKFNPALLVFLIFPLMGIVAAIAVGGRGNQPAGTLAPPAVQYTPQVSLVNNPAPDFTLKTPGGQSIQLSSLRGQWVFLNFWATWCPPCRQEMPTFQQFMDGKFGPIQGKATVLAVDSMETVEQVNSFQTDLKLTSVPIVMDTDGAVNRLYAVVKWPTTYVIDPTGMIRDQQFGEMTPKLIQAYLKKANIQ